MIAFPNSKINLGLHVAEKLPDGYHRIETVMYPVPLCDILEIIPSGKAYTTLTVTGAAIDGEPEQNLCFKAWKLMSGESGIPPVDIYLHKIIPTGAGLGGGSADAAFTLKMLNSMFSLGLDAAKLRNLALKLGMDCPFFIENKPALATGKGEILSSCGVNLAGLWLALVKPPVHVSTAEAYAGIVPKPAKSPIPGILTLPVNQWKTLLTNDFENSIFSKYPAIEKIRQDLYGLGASYARMSGSGSAVFGLFEKEPEPGGLFEGCFVFKTFMS